MNKIIKLNKEGLKTKIIIKNNFINKYLKKISKNENNIFCIVDEKVKYIIKDLLKIKRINFIFIKSGEGIKNFKNYKILSEKLLSKNINRDSILVSIGGGTLGDLSGFIASTLLRGIQFKLIPTTLLSQVDSSIGGKNGINTVHGKNLIGSFYQPNEVVIDTEVLKSLPVRELKSGYAEILKHSLIKDKKLFNWLEKNNSKLFNLNTKVLEEAIFRSIMVKLYYVKNDPKEKLINNKSRSMLNFGHTIGHSLEAFYNFGKALNHGEAVSIGMIVESIISNKLGYLSDIDFARIMNHFKKTKMKVFDKNIKNNRIDKIILKDKKNLNNKINIVLLSKIGSSFFARNINLKTIKNIIAKI